VLPYTPNVLREVGEKVGKQLETRHSDQEVLERYHRLLETEMAAIHAIGLAQGEVAMSWQQVRKFMRRDI
jgi:hypothetical protein